MSEYKKDPFLAGILSFLVPGLGQIYMGKIWRGIGWFFLVAIGYVCFVLPGVIFWILNIWDAVEETKKLEK